MGTHLHTALIALCLGAALALAACGGGGGGGGDGTDDGDGLSSNCDLRWLRINAGLLTPDFAPDVLAYTVGPAGLGGANSVRVRGSVAHDDATITVNDVAVESGDSSQAIPLPDGSTTVDVVVTAPDGTTKTYTVVFNRIADLISSNADLRTLEPSAGDLAPAFDPATLTYAVACGIDTGSATLTPTADDPGATITVNGFAVTSGEESSSISLPIGITPVAIRVVAEDSSTVKNYSVVFTRSGLSTQEAYIKASNTDPGDGFGYGLAVSGDTLVVSGLKEASNATGVNGTQTDNSAAISGAAYVFTRSGGTWSQQAYLKASNAEAGDYFGVSCAISGDTIVVGASGESSSTTGVNGTQTDNSTGSSGAAYVFTRSGTTWSQQAYLKASNTEAGDNFGLSVAVDGDTVVVGAPYEDSNATGVNGTQSDNSVSNAGAAYVFARSGTTWAQQAYLKVQYRPGSPISSSDWFGFDVAVSGDTVVVGAEREGSGSSGVNSTPVWNAGYSGAAYVFTRTGSTWSSQAYLKASNAEGGDSFGTSVAISGNTVVVGAQFEDSNATGVNGTQTNNGAVAAGAAYVFTRSGTTWTQQAYLKASNAEADDWFGTTAGVSGDAIVVGTVREDSGATGVNGDGSDNSVTESGAAYVFTRTGSTWTQQAYLKASNPEEYDARGYEGGGATISGSAIVFGAYWEDSSATGVNGTQTDNSSTDSGAVYVFR